MESRPLGTSSLHVSAVGLGCNNLGRSGTWTESQEGTTAVVGAALEAGITLFDTADVYGKEFGLSERMLGEAIRGRRDGVIVATKFGHVDLAPPLADGAPMGSRAYIRAAVEGSLERLGIETIDLFQQHTPDPRTPIDETLAALAELVEEGKVRELGNSNFSAAQLREADESAIAHGTPRYVSAQNQYNLLDRSIEEDLVPAARSLGIGLLPYFRSRTACSRASSRAPSVPPTPASRVSARTSPTTRPGMRWRPTPRSARSAASRWPRRRSAGSSRIRRCRASSPGPRDPSRCGRTPRPDRAGGRMRASSPRSTASSLAHEPR